MDRRRMRSFVTLAEELHFGRAASRCNMTQSALSQQIRQLENDLEAELFYRTKRYVALTRAGEALLPEARKILQNMDDAIYLARQVSNGIEGRLTVGATAPSLFIMVPELVRQFRQIMPGIQVMVREMTTTEQEFALRNGDIDVGICHPPLDDSTIVLTTLSALPFDIVMARSNPLASKRRLQLKDLANEHFIVFARNIAPNMYDGVIATCKDAGFSPKVILEASPAQSIVGMAACGVGIGFVASTLQHFPHPLAVYRRLDGPAPMLTLGASYLSHKISQPIDTLVTVAKRIGAALQ